MDNDPESPLTDQERDVLFGVDKTPKERLASGGDAPSIKAAKAAPVPVFKPVASKPKPYTLVRPRFISQHELLELRTLLEKTASTLEQQWGTRLRDRIQVNIRQIQSSCWADLFSVFGIDLYPSTEDSTLKAAKSTRPMAELAASPEITPDNKSEVSPEVSPKIKPAVSPELSPSSETTNPYADPAVGMGPIQYRIDAPQTAPTPVREPSSRNWMVSWLSSKELSWSLPLIFPSPLLSNIIDRLLGSTSDPCWDNRLTLPLTALEQRLFVKAAESFAQNWRQSWAEIIPLTFDPVRCANYLALTNQDALDPQDPVAVCEFSVLWKGIEQPLILALPHYSLDNIQRQMSVARRSVLKSTSPLSLESVHPGIRHARVRVTAQLARASMTAGEFTQLRVGDILTTDQPSDSPINVLVEGILKFHAQIGQYRGSKAIQISDLNP